MTTTMTVDPWIRTNNGINSTLSFTTCRTNFQPSGINNGNNQQMYGNRKNTMTNFIMDGTNDGTNQIYSNQMNTMTNFIIYGTNNGTKQ